jgi:hypothetical protein
MTVTMTLKNLIRLAEKDLDENFYEVKDLYTEYYPGAPINNGAMVEFILDQFKQNLEQKGITLKVI